MNGFKQHGISGLSLRALVLATLLVLSVQVAAGPVSGGIGGAIVGGILGDIVGGSDGAAWGATIGAGVGAVRGERRREADRGYYDDRQRWEEARRLEDQLKRELKPTLNP